MASRIRTGERQARSDGQHTRRDQRRRVLAISEGRVAAFRTCLYPTSSVVPPTVVGTARGGGPGPANTPTARVVGSAPRTVLIGPLRTRGMGTNDQGRPRGVACS